MSEKGSNAKWQVTQRVETSSLGYLVPRFDAISLAFGDPFDNPQLVTRMRHGIKDVTARFYTSFDYVEVKDECILIGAYGNGSTPEESMLDYYNQIVGKTLVYHAMRDDRKEVVVV